MVKRKLLTAVLAVCGLIAVLPAEAQTQTPAAPAAPATPALAPAKPKPAPAKPPRPIAKQAPTSEELAAKRMNEWTVGLAGGLLEGSFIRFAAEIGKVLDDPPNLRVLPFVSYGAVGNVEDLLYVKGVDVAITNADALDYFKSQGKIANIGDRINYLARFPLSEVHIYARPEIKRLEDLAGKKVSFNTAGSAANLTGGIVFDRLGVKPERVFINNSIALEKMRAGEIAAIVHVVSKPNELFAKLKPEPGFHFLPLEYSDKFSDYYVPTEITNEDYPALIQKDEKIPSIAVSTVLAVYNWPKGSDRYRRVARFVEQLFAKFEQLQQPPFQPKWKEVNLASTVRGWKRYPVAEAALARMTAADAVGGAAADAAAPEQFAAFLALRGRSAGGPALTKEERETLFKEFRAWLAKSGGRAP